MLRKNRIKDYDTYPALIKNFLNYQGSIRNSAVKTVQAYAYDLKFFFRYLTFVRYEGLYGDFKDIDISELDEEIIRSVKEEDILEFLYFMKSERKIGVETQARYQTSISMFYEYLFVHKELIAKNPCEKITMPKLPKNRVPKYLTEKQSIHLLESLNQSDPYYYRDYCIILIFLTLGVRLSELVSINIQDIRDDRTIVILGKGNKERSLIIPQNCNESIKLYRESLLKSNKVIKDKEALFLSARGTRISVRRVEQIVADALDNAGLGGMGFSPHKLRHTAATLMYQKGQDVRALKEVLGHNELNTTQIYTHVNSEQINQAIESNPIADFKPKAV